jgi:hypothetical protein
MNNNVAEITPRRSDCAACLLTATRMYLNSPSELPQNWGKINQTSNHYHSEPMEISSILCLQDITEWGCWQEETHIQYADFLNEARNILPIIPDGVEVKASCSPA